MDKKKGLLGYFSQVFMIYGITVLLLNVFCMIFGADAQAVSTIFSLGNRGIGVSTMLQFFVIIALTIFLRVVFMTDTIIKRMPLIIRIIAMFAGVLGLTIVFVFAFGWFPVTEVKAWIAFIGSFAISCTISTLISVYAEKQENKKLDEALRRFKEEQ
ncbi:MAG: hypothetical protein UH080_06105 [Ruminococcus sp.]|nr:hypothetical protein [Ruminococcus sp.]